MNAGAYYSFDSKDAIGGLPAVKRHTDDCPATSPQSADFGSALYAAAKAQTGGACGCGKVLSGGKKRRSSSKNSKGKKSSGKKSKRKRGGAPPSSAIRQKSDIHRKKLIDCLDLEGLHEDNFYSAENLKESITIKFNEGKNMVEFYDPNTDELKRNFKVNDKDENKTNCPSDIAKAINFFNPRSVRFSSNSS